MQTKVLNKEELIGLLQARFENDSITSLSELPHPHTMPNAKKAAIRVKEAIQNKEPITIVGDYDVDGVVSSAILEEFLQKNGADVDTVIPCRFQDGYGLGVGIIERIKTKLVITVDNGIAAIEASKLCEQRGIELIIIDHHTIGETLPIAHAIVHPKIDEGFVFGEICAAEVVWYFMAALKIELGVNDNLKEYLDLVAIATIADVMPLRDINRVIVKAGIDVIKTSKRPAIATMRSKLGKTEFSSTDIAYKISPRLNSAGRLVLAKEAFSFLRAKSVEEASIFFDKLDSLNEERKKIELSVYEEAMTTVDKDADIIVVAKEGWHEGVVGIVASRLAQHFKKPSIVFSIEGQNAKGSARSIGNINIFELISKSASLLSNFGGHKMAAGVSLNAANIDAFRALINETARGYTPSGECVCKECVGEVPFCDIDDELANILDRFEPYGEANEKPVFFGSAKTVAEFKTIGAGKGFKMTLVDDEGTDVRAVCFRTSNTPKNGDKINLRFSVYKNDFFGGSVELMVEEIVAS